jgi:uncharacterized protein YeaO (DUF488 family)
LKIEFEPGVKIVGTKRVSAKGQVSGLTEFAGKEVMIILVPKEGPAIKPTHEVLYHELQKAAEEHMELAFKNSKKLKEVFGTPQAAAEQFFDRYAPESVKKMQESMDGWLENFKVEFIKSQMEELINAQMKVAFKQYENLRERFASPDEATREFIKKYTPKSTQKVMEDIEKWSETIVPKEFRDEIQEAAQEHIKLAFDQYEQLNKTFGSPDKAAREFMEKHAPKAVNELMNNMDAWLETYKPKAKKRKK